ncbi:hypothetical protein HYX58_00350 [Candidatus Dependentiae bacterium]|nr:hypothetical protein [Candidatus Dependentiae bacterium]
MKFKYDIGNLADIFFGRFILLESLTAWKLVTMHYSFLMQKSPRILHRIIIWLLNPH